MAITAMDFLKSDSQKASAGAYTSEKSDHEASKTPNITTERRESSREEDVAYGSAEEIRRTKDIQSNVGFLRKLRKGEEWMDAKMGVEAQGIDRVPEEEKQPPSMWNIFLFWWSLNVHVGVLPLGVLGAEFGLDLKQTVGATVVGNLLGCLCTAYDGTLSPKVCQDIRAILENDTDQLLYSLASVKLQSPDTPSASGAPSSAQFSTSSSAVASWW